MQRFHRKTHRTLINRTQNSLVGTRIEIADTFLSRLVGLLGRRGLDPGSGMLIQPSSGVHTFGMRFPIDVVALDRKLCVLSTHKAVRPWRTSGLGWRTHAVLELPTGHLEQFPLAAGDQLEFVESTRE